jgi:6-phosphofructokinase 2
MKPSLREFENLTGEILPDVRARSAAAHAIIDRGGCELIALTLGEEGALLIGREVSLQARAPKVKAVSTVGAGDSFLGALVWSLAQGKQLPEALRVAVAAGSAALLAPGTELCRTEDIARLEAQVRVMTL